MPSAVGAAVGTRVGTFEGTAVDGAPVWPCIVGAAVVGIAVGTLVGNAVGFTVCVASRGGIIEHRVERGKKKRGETNRQGQSVESVGFSGIMIETAAEKNTERKCRQRVVDRDRDSDTKAKVRAERPTKELRYEPHRHKP